MKKSKNITEAAFLRQKAEEQLLERYSVDVFDGISGQNDDVRNNADSLKLIHELEVHQIELEMQNEELIQALDRAATAIALFDFAPMGYFILNQEGKICQLNLNGATIIGKSRSVLVNKNFNQFVTKDTLPVFNDFLHNIFATNSKHTCELRLCIQGNPSIFVDIEGIISDNEHQCLLTLRDISERKQKELELISAREKAEESDRLKSAFLANMSHEIRTPLNSIIGFSEFLIRPDSGALHQQFAQIIIDSGNNLLAIIDDILDISKIEAGQILITKENLSVHKLISDIHKFLFLKAKNKGLELRLDPSNPKEEIFIESDVNRLRQILVNFVSNSIKFTNKGFIEVGIKKVGAYVQFHVTDTGIGISKEYHEQIFERFRQVDQNHNRKYGGNGLGLAISKRLVELLGGAIWIESEPDKGSTFYFLVPVSEHYSSEKPVLASKVSSSIPSD